MGCVTEIAITGDNDEPIFPMRYYRHYLYCDQCGSFELQAWERPKEGFFAKLLRLTELRSVRCLQCKSVYEFGSPFFTKLDHNPRGFTMADVPRPLYRAYSLTGNTIGPA